MPTAQIYQARNDTSTHNPAYFCYFGSLETIVSDRDSWLPFPKSNDDDWVLKLNERSNGIRSLWSTRWSSSNRAHCNIMINLVVRCPFHGICYLYIWHRLLFCRSQFSYNSHSYFYSWFEHHSLTMRFFNLACLRDLRIAFTNTQSLP